ncbi:MAG TPA: hypothetical protein VFK57_24105 [Vicinamibacterales bacterium]|nr:hypothetical protein [Vicinamibacterales bacterium]
MRNHVSHLAVAILTAAIGIACTGRSNAVDNERTEQSGGARGLNQRVSLEGCVEAAPGPNAWVLRHVAEVPPAQQPQGQERMEHAPLVPRGSWVRLVSGNDDLNEFLGKRVTLTGHVRDAGGNTIGTSGQSSPMPRAGEANGQAPQVAVEQVKELESPSGTCQQRLGDTARPTGK